jgi:hypothetical protein
MTHVYFLKRFQPCRWKLFFYGKFYHWSKIIEIRFLTPDQISAFNGIFELGTLAEHKTTRESDLADLSLSRWPMSVFVAVFGGDGLRRVVRPPSKKNGESGASTSCDQRSSTDKFARGSKVGWGFLARTTWCSVRWLGVVFGPPGNMAPPKALRRAQRATSEHFKVVGGIECVLKQ